MSNLSVSTALSTSLQQLQLVERGITEHNNKWISDSITDCFLRVRDLIELSEDTEADPDLHIPKSILALINTLLYTHDLDSQEVSWNSLRPLQKLAILGLQNWIIEKLEQEKIWHIVMPTGQWKTNLAAIISWLVEGKTVYISTDNTGIDATIETYNTNYDSQESESRASKINTKTFNNDHTVVWIYSEFKKAYEAGNIDIDEVRVVFVDEADINGLSPDREAFFTYLAEERGIIVIWMSATEMLGSWKDLQSVFKDEILRFPMPESLPELYSLGLVPNIDFHDKILDASMQTSSDSIDKWIDDEDVDELVGSDQWIHGIMSYHVENNKGENFILWYRNNKFNQRNIDIAKEYWLKLVSFTWEEDIETRRIILSQLESWEIDGIVWSVLVWRWLDVPSCWVVYNSTVTYSPQIFWQLLWRAFRLDPNNPEKYTSVTTFLPKDIFIEDDKRVGAWWYPISSASFFKPWYFYWDGVWEDASFKLRELPLEDIMSVVDFMKVARNARRMEAYGDHIEVLARALLWSRWISWREISYLWWRDVKALSQWIQRKKKNEWKAKSQSKARPRNFSVEDVEQKDRIHNFRTSFSKAEESRLLEEYYTSWDNAALAALTAAHDIIFDAIAEILHFDDSYFEKEDLIQIARMAFVEALEEKHIIWKSERLISYVLKYIFEKVERESYLSIWEVHHHDFSDDWDDEGDINKSRYDKELRLKRDIQNIKDFLFWYNIDLEDISSEELVRVVGIGKKRVEAALDLLWLEFDSFQDDSIDIEHHWEETPESVMIEKALWEAINNALLSLNAREERTLRESYWIWTASAESTYEEVWRKFGVTRERIRQIELKAIRKLKHPSRSKELRSFF